MSVLFVFGLSMGIMGFVLYDCGMYVLKILLNWDTILSCTIEELFLIIGYDNLLSPGVHPFKDSKTIVSSIFVMFFSICVADVDGVWFIIIGLYLFNVNCRSKL